MIDDEVMDLRLNKELMQLIFELEYIVGNTCYNPHSTDGYTGDVGRSLRYPVWADLGDISVEDLMKFYGKMKIRNVIPENVSSIKYKFGANEMSIGCALRDVLLFLEKRYSIDFNNLEEEYQKQSE